jgi:methylated-DNA-protein-cysteine methyltransferase-like protein
MVVGARKTREKGAAKGRGRKASPGARGATKGGGTTSGSAPRPGRDPGGVVVKFEPFYRAVRRIPRGRVATYGQVAAVAGRPRGARLCGYALSALRNTVHRVPWQRVLGARGTGRAGISLRDPVGAAVQRTLLEREGVTVDGRGRVDLERFGWRPRGGGAGRGPVRPGGPLRPPPH